MTITLLSFLSWLMRASLQASAIAVIVWLLTGLLRTRLSASLRFGLWLLVFARLVLPVGIPLHLSWPQGQRNRPVVALTPGVQMPLVSPAHSVQMIVPAQITFPTVVHQSTPAHKQPISWTNLALAIWLSGVMVFLLRAMIGNLRLSRVIRTLPAEEDPGTLRQVESAARQLGVRRTPRVLVAPENLGPALAGVCRPALLLPRCGQLAPSEIHLVILHEMAHLRRNDVAVNCMVTFLTGLHWFNPLMWWASSRLREEREMACDEMVLACGNETAPSDYGQVLLKLIKTIIPPAVREASTAVGLFEKRHTFNRRISMIARYDPTQRPSRIFAAAALLLVGAVALTQAAGPATQPAAGGNSSPAAQPHAGSGPVGSPENAPGGTPVAAHPPSGSTQEQTSSSSMPPGFPYPRPFQGGVASAAVDSDPNATAATTAALSRKLPELRFNANSLSDVVDFLRDVTGANIFVDWVAFARFNIAKDAQVTLRVKDVTLATALDLVLQSAAGEGALGYTVDGGVIHISIASAGNKLMTETYDFSDSVKDETSFRLIESTIAMTIDPGNNSDAQPGFSTPNITIARVGWKLVVTTSAANQQRIGAMLQSLQKDAGVTAGKETPKP